MLHSILNLLINPNLIPGSLLPYVYSDLPSDISYKNTILIWFLIPLLIIHVVSVKMVKFPAFIGRWKAKRLSASGGLRPLNPHRGLCPLDPRWGLRPQTPDIGSRSRARHDRGSSPPNVICWHRPCQELRSIGEPRASAFCSCFEVFGYKSVAHFWPTWSKNEIFIHKLTSGLHCEHRSHQCYFYSAGGTLQLHY